MLVNERVVFSEVLQAYHDMLVDPYRDPLKNYEPRRLPLPAPEDLDLYVSQMHIIQVPLGYVHANSSSDL